MEVGTYSARGSGVFWNRRITTVTIFHPVVPRSRNESVWFLYPFSRPLSRPALRVLPRNSPVTVVNRDRAGDDVLPPDVRSDIPAFLFHVPKALYVLQDLPSLSAWPQRV